VYRDNKNILIIGLILFLTNASHFSQSWVQIQMIDSVEVYSITEHKGELFAVSSSDIFKSMASGSVWLKLQTKPNVNSYYYTIFSYKNTLYIGTFDRGIYRSTNSGDSWDEFNNGLSSDALGIVEFAGKGDSLYVATDASGIHVNNLENQVSWKTFNTGLYQVGSNAIYSTENYLLANLGLYLFKRNDKDVEWQNIFVDYNQSQRQFYDFIEHGEYIFAGTDNGVYRGSLDAMHWENKDILAFPTRDISVLAVYNNRLFAGLLFGGQHWIFSSDNYGESWEIHSHEFSYLYDMTVHYKKLWAARSDGLWYFDINIPTGIKEPNSIIINKFSLNQNYPNPFNPTTKIKFSIPSDNNVEIKVFNVLGKEVAALLNEYRQAGNYELEFDASNLASGTYIYRIICGDYTEKKKMILLK
jgi:hypothetical protein